MTTIILPGIGGSGEAHWQTLWERADPAMVRFQPASWDAPDLSDWLRALDEAIGQADRPPLPVAHSLACLLVAHWVAWTKRRAAVRGAFLVAVPDPDGPAFPHAEAGTFRDVPDQPLPFPALVVASSDDPYGPPEVSRKRAAAWGAGFVKVGAHGHLNGSCGLGDWPTGAMLLEAFRAGTHGPAGRTGVPPTGGGTNTIEVRPHDLSGAATRELLALHLANMHAVSPPGGVFALDLSGLRAPGVTVWSAWIGGELADVGALKEFGDGVAEVKSMRTHPDHLRRGVAAALLEHLIEAARRRGVRRLSLETGSGPAFEAALALYRKRGFRNGGPFADYEQSSFNQFLHVDL